MTTSYRDGAVTIQEFFLAPGSEPLPITAGPDGNAWFVERGVNRVASITAAGVLREIPIPTQGMSPQSIAATRSGQVWFGASSLLGTVDMDGTVSLYPAPVHLFPYWLVADDADHIWAMDSETLWRRDSAGLLTPFTPPNPPGYANNLSSLVVGPDGNLWCFRGTDGQLFRMTPAGDFTAFPMSGGIALAAGADGHLWATMRSGLVAQISTDGAIVSTHPAPDLIGSIPFITAGPDGALWIVHGNQTPPAISRMTLDGAIERFVLPGSPTYMMGFAATADGALWFTEGDADKVGRVTIRP